MLTKFSFKGAMESLNGVVLLETSGITLSPLRKFLSIIFSCFFFEQNSVQYRMNTGQMQNWQLATAYCMQGCAVAVNSFFSAVRY